MEINGAERKDDLHYFLDCTIKSDFRNDSLYIIRRFINAIDITTQRAPVENVLSAFGTSHLGMIDIQATTKSKYYDHIVLLYLESRRCRHLSIIFVCF